MSFITKPLVLATAVSALALAGCGGDSSSSSDDEKARLSVGMTDAPIDTALAVYVQFSAITLIKADGDEEDAESQRTITFDEPVKINLLDYQHGKVYPLLEDEEIDAGEYSQIRLMVDTELNSDTYIELNDGSTFELTISSGAQTGLKLVNGFTATAGEEVSFTLDFDLRKSITVTGTGEFKLRPTIRIIDNLLAGHIGGTVAANTCAADDALAVYIYEGEVENPDDLGSEDEPLATASVDTDLSYQASFLSAGTYTAALTCMADEDDPEVDDDAFGEGEGFVAVSTVITVEADATAEWNPGE